MPATQKTERSDFVEEIQEHLSGLEQDLLTIENDGIKHGISLLNKVFRAVHAVYGGASLFGYENLKQLSLATGNLIHLLKTNIIASEAEIYSLLQSSIQSIRSLSSNLDSDNIDDILEELVTLNGAITANLPNDRLASLTSLVSLPIPESQESFEISQLIYDLAVAEGMHLYILKYDVKKDILSQEKTAMDVVRELQQAGILLDCKTKSNLKKKKWDMTKSLSSLDVLAATILELEFVETLTGLSGDAITIVNRADTDISQQQQEEREIRTDDLFITEKDEPQMKSNVSGSLEIDEVLIEFPDSQSPPADTNLQLADTLSNVQESLSSLDQIQQPKDVAEPSTPVTKPVAVQKNTTAQKPTAQADSSSPSSSSSSLRVNVKVLDTLMTMAGELVLTRNQLLQSVSSRDFSAIDRITQRVDLITSELQAAIMSTRMQPVGNVFSKFNRVVRDLSRNLQKEIDLIIEGEDVELDKTIIEAISDPLTHLIRNSVDHGLETPNERTGQGKPTTGTLKLSAYHEAGQVIIEIMDDGRGVNHEKVKAKALEIGLYDQSQLDAMSQKDLVQIILKPGFSTAEQVTDISGRGVGMDVVHTNLSKLGGVIDIDTQIGKGTTIRIKLPLTLAIIPSLLVSAHSERFAIPQVNLLELVRIPPAQVERRIENVGEALVMRLRGNLLPLVPLSDVLGITSNGVNTTENWTQEHSADSNQTKTGVEGSGEAMNIAVVSAGNFNYGLIIDELLDMEEIVVKPLGYHLGMCKENAGATILGDGRVALILDIVGVSKTMNIHAVSDSADDRDSKHNLSNNTIADIQSLLIVENGLDERFAFALGLITRIEKISAKTIEKLGNINVIKYRGSTLALISIEDVAKVQPRKNKDQLFAIIFTISGREIGILVSELIDIMDVELKIDEMTFRQPGILGSAIIMDQITMMVDPFGMISTARPEWNLDADKSDSNETATILVAEDSDFFRKQITSFIAAAGYNVVDAADGLKAWDELKKADQKFDLVITDIEMPNLDGLGLTKKIRGDNNLRQLPVIAITSLAGEEDEAVAKQSGVDRYMVKLDREAVIAEIADLIPGRNGAAVTA